MIFFSASLRSFVVSNCQMARFEFISDYFLLMFSEKNLRLFAQNFIVSRFSFLDT